MQRIQVAGERPYDVIIGRGLEQQVIESLPGSADRVAVMHAPFFADRAAEYADRWRDQGRQTLMLSLPDAESAKTAQTAETCWAALGAAGFTRSDAVVSLGGGATTDLAGFVAATWLRGIRIVHVPTTMLAMVDAAVGGKTGINTAAGKNLVGAISPPTAVVCDLDLLSTLPRADLAAGLAEVVKAGFIADPTILELVTGDPEASLTPTSAAVDELVRRAVAVKAAVVADDLTESIDRTLGREILNYGHTLGHAIEKVEGYTWRHGDAISVGMVYAAALSHAAGRLSGSDVRRHRDLLSALGLPIRYPHPDRWPELLAAMRVDKKARGATLRFIVLDGIGRPGLLAGPSDEELADAFSEVS